ncbi:MAG: hypothetical protein WDN69_00990 [Aliidongia sp.]
MMLRALGVFGTFFPPHQDFGQFRHHGVLDVLGQGALAQRSG